MTHYTNNEGIPLALAVLFVNDLYDHSDEPNTISVTTLLDSVRQIILGMRAIGEGTKDVSDMVASAYGTSLHSSLEAAWLDPYNALESLGYPLKTVSSFAVNPEWEDVDRWVQQGNPCIPVYVEQRSIKQIAGWNISGKFDLIIDGRLNDLKNRKVWAYLNSSNDKKDILQASIYRWLNQDKVTEEDFSILWLFTDFDSLQASIKKDYPKNRWLEQKFRLLSIQETERYIVDKLALIDKYLHSSEQDLPLCSKEDLWQSETKWKYYTAVGNKNAASGGGEYTSSTEAYIRLSKEGRGEVREFPGKVKRCKHCSASSVCSQYKNLVEQNLI